MGFWVPHVREAVEVFGTDRVMFGTDYGPVPLDPKEHIDIVNALEISEADKEIKVTAEIPGLEEKDVEVLLEDGVLTLKGEKRSEIEDKGKQFSERFYGHFERRIPLGVEVEEDKIEARFKNGVLNVMLPKSPKAQSQVKRIAIKS